MNVPIDLRELEGPLSQFFADTITSFKSEHPSEVISTIALYVFPFERISSLCLDTKLNSDAQVKKWKNKGPDWYGADNLGDYNESPEDFAFPDYADFEFRSWPNLHEVGRQIQFLDHTGGTVLADLDADGDDGLNRALFPAFCEYVRKYNAWKSAQHVAPFRSGVVMHDSKCEAFWIIP